MSEKMTSERAATLLRGMKSSAFILSEGIPATTEDCLAALRLGASAILEVARLREEVKELVEAVAWTFRAVENERGHLKLAEELRAILVKHGRMTKTGENYEWTT